MLTLFPLGQIVATPGRWLHARERSIRLPVSCPVMQSGTGANWNQVISQSNEYSVAHGFRLLSSYQTDAGEALWIITEADRSATTLFLPEEY